VFVENLNPIPEKKKGCQMAAFFVLVEVAGLEPASASPPPSALHAYSAIYFNAVLPDGQGKHNAIPDKF
jgi:hypothetical protein